MLKHTIARRALTTSRATSSVRKTISAVFVGLLVLCLASPSAALDLKPYAVLLVGQSSDLLTTIHENPAHPCVETNALLGPHPSILKVAIPKLAIIGGIALLMRFTETRETKAARVIAKSTAYLAGAVGAKDGLHNYRTCGW